MGGRAGARGLTFASIVLAQLVIWSTSAAVAQDRDWAATLAPAASGAAYAPTEALAVRVPDGLPFEVLLRLGLEVDAIDVTPLLAFDNQVFTFNPPQPLGQGPHTLRFVESQPGGDIVERGSWSIDVAGAAQPVAPAGVPAQPAAVASAPPPSGSLVNSFEISQRLAENGIEGAPDRLVVSGSGYGNGDISRGPWSFASNGNYLVQSEHDRAPTNKPVDLGEYNFTGRYDGEQIVGKVALGHQDLGADNFIMSGFNRRGFSAGIGSADQTISVTGFGLRTEAVVGANNFTGVNDSTHRVSGVMATTHPIAALGQDFSITGLFYDGEGGDTGTGGEGDSTINKGDGWVVGAESFLLERSVQLKGQYAKSDFEFGDVTVGDNSESSNAWSGLIAYSPLQGQEVAGEFVNLTVGAQYERVGTFFASLANPTLAADRKTTMAYSDLSWGTVTANAQALHQTNNVDDLASVPTDRLLSFQLSANYYPTVTPPAAGEVDWLGQPFVNANLGIADNKRVDTPAGYLGSGTDNQNRTITLGGGSNFAQWGWQLSETFTRFTDDTNTAPDTDNYLTDFSANWMVNDAVKLDGGLQWGLLRDRSADTHNNTINLNLGLQAQIIPETLRTTLNYNLNLMTGHGDTPDNTIANGEVEWTLLAPQPNRVGVALAIQGLLEKKNGNADDSLNGTKWQVFSVLRLTAPLEY